MDKALEISIGMCTYKRVHLLETLKSLFELDIPPNILINKIIVVDNDIEKSAQTLIQAMDVPNNFRIQYIHEPVKNIAIARNQILANATGEWLAMIDDDEVADKAWLKSFVGAANQYNAAVYLGPVISQFPPDVPDWIKIGKFFDRRRLTSGTLVQTGGTGNAFIHLPTLQKYNHSFSKEYGLTGGEDAHFFYTLFKNKEFLRWVDEAVVVETVESHRLNEKFLLQRGFRIGQTFSRYRSKDICSSYLNKLKYRLTNIMKYSVSGIIAAMYNISQSATPAHKAKYMKWKLKSVDAKGKLSGLKSSVFVEIYNNAQ